MFPDAKIKSLDHLIRLLVSAVGRDGNFILNVGRSRMDRSALLMRRACAKWASGFIGTARAFTQRAAVLPAGRLWRLNVSGQDDLSAYSESVRRGAYIAGAAGKDSGMLDPDGWKGIMQAERRWSRNLCEGKCSRDEHNCGDDAGFAGGGDQDDCDSGDAESVEWKSGRRVLVGRFPPGLKPALILVGLCGG